MTVRRNILPNPLPVGTTGWAATESNATRVAFNNPGGGLHYKGTATAANCQAGVLWNDASQITVRPGENYGLVLPITVASRPAVGLVRALVLWKAADGTTAVETWFSNDIPVGASEVREILTAPAGAYRASVAVLYMTTAAATPDTTTPFEWTTSQMLLEPLGPPQASTPGAVVNHIVNPSLEYGINDWYPHNHNADALLGSTWARQSGWSSVGTKSMRHAITATSGILPGTTFYGFIGSYVGGLYPVAPGDVLHWQCDTKVLAGPASGPGIFLEIFFYYYDGDPAHTAVLQHTNGDSIDQPLLIGTPQTLAMSATCPAGANVAQVTVVMASGAPSALLDFYADAAMLTINQVPTGYADGDTPGAGWDGLPGKSTSRNPGRSARIPGAPFTGDDYGAHWEGAPYQSMSSMSPPILRAHAPVTQRNMQLMATSARRV